MMALARKKRQLHGKGAAALLFVVWLVLGISIPAFATDPQETDVIHLSRQARATRYSLAPATKSQPDRLLDRLGSGSDRARPNSAADENRFLLVPLDPQLDTPDRPAARPLPHARSYLFSVGTPEKPTSYVGLAKIEREQNNPLLGLQEKQYNTELLFGYTWKGFGSLLFGHALQFDNPQDASGKFVDGGWRFKFFKTF